MVHKCVSDYSVGELGAKFTKLLTDDSRFQKEFLSTNLALACGLTFLANSSDDCRRLSQAMQLLSKEKKCCCVTRGYWRNTMWKHWLLAGTEGDSRC